jgi:hypothetical protein
MDDQTLESGRGGGRRWRYRCFTVGAGSKKWLLDLGKRFVKTKASPQIGGYTFSLSHRLI